MYSFSLQVPYNVPVSAFDLLQRFLKNKSFVDNKAPLVRFKAPYSTDKVATPTVEASFRPEAPSQLLDRTRSDDGLLERAGLIVASVLAGFVLALLFTNHGRRGYQRVPNASVDEQ